MTTYLEITTRQKQRINIHGRLLRVLGICRLLWELELCSVKNTIVKKITELLVKYHEFNESKKPEPFDCQRYAVNVNTWVYMMKVYFDLC